jgi:hypothetical protein
VFPHLDIKSEHQVGPYLFDFAVNDLRLLIEIDPFSTHSAVGRKIRDWKKAKLAREKGWSLVRLSPYPPRKLTARAISAVRQRYKKLFPDTRWPNTPAKEHPKNEATVDGFIKRWDLFFEYRFGFQPQFRTGDVEALETFLEEHPGVVQESLERVLWIAWVYGNRKPAKCPNSANATSMQSFFNHIDEILDELGYDKNYLTNPRNSHEPEKTLIQCSNCRHRWRVFEDVLTATCPECKTIVPGPLA